MSVRSIFAGILAVGILAGCAQIKTDPITTTTRTISEKNYVINTAIRANVGEPIIRVKNYNEGVTVVAGYETPADLAVNGNNNSFSLVKGKKIAAPMQANIDGKNYRILLTRGPLKILVDESGKIHDHPLMGNVLQAHTHTITPADIRLVPTTVEAVKPLAQEPGWSNFELLYSGSTSTDLKLAYREYSTDKESKLLQSQDISYPKKTGPITFKNFVIDVVEISADAITARITAD